MKFVNKHTALQSFKLLVTVKRKQGVIVDNDDKAIIWDDYLKTLIKQGLVNPNSVTKWKNPYRKGNK